MATNLKKGLQTVSEELKKLSQRIEKLIAGVDKPAKSKSVKVKSAKKIPAKQAKPAKKPVIKLRKRAPGKKESKMPTNLVVLDIIQNSAQGIEIGILKEKSGFQGQKLYNALYALKKQGKVKNPRKGIYEKV